MKTDSLKAIVNKDLVKDLVARVITLERETLIDIDNSRFKVLLTSGYCNGKKISKAMLAKQGDKVNPIFLSFESFRAAKIERKVVLVIFDTILSSTYNFTIDSRLKGESYVIKDPTDSLKKALSVNVSFNYRVCSEKVGLRKLLSLIGESYLKRDFLTNSDIFIDQKSLIENEIKLILNSINGSCKRMSEVTNEVQSYLDSKLDQLLQQYGIKVGPVSVNPTVMGDAELNPHEKAENYNVNAEAKKMEISTDADVDRHKNRENNTTNIEGTIQANKLKGLENDGKIIDARTEAEIDLMRAETENKIFKAKSFPQLLIELVKEKPELFLGIIKAVSNNHTVGVLQNNVSKESVPSTIIQYLMGLDPASQQKISLKDGSPSEILEENTSLTRKRKIYGDE